MFSINDYFMKLAICIDFIDNTYKVECWLDIVQEDKGVVFLFLCDHSHDNWDLICILLKIRLFHVDLKLYGFLALCSQT